MIVNGTRLNNVAQNMLVSASSGTYNGEHFSKLTIAEQNEAMANIDSATNYLKAAYPSAFLMTESDFANRVFFDKPTSKIPYSYSVIKEARKPR